MNKSYRWIIGLDGSYIDTPDNKLTGFSDNVEEIVVIAPFDTASAVSFGVGNEHKTAVSQYMSLSTDAVSDWVDETEVFGSVTYQDIADYHVWRIPLRAVAKAYVSKYRSSFVYFSFRFGAISINAKCITDKGTFGADNLLPTSGQTLGDYYALEDLYYTLTVDTGGKTLVLGKGMYVYWSSAGTWIKVGEILSANTSSNAIAVDPSFAVNDEISEDEINYLVSFESTIYDHETRINTLETDKAEDSEVVHLTGAETIAGVKTFSDEPVLPSKSTEATDSATKPATEAQVYKLVNGNMVKSIAYNGTTYLITYTHYDDTTTSALTLAELKAFIGEAVTGTSGLLSSDDKAKIDTLYALLNDTTDGSADSVVDTIADVLSIMSAYPEGVTLVSALAAKQDVANMVTSWQATPDDTHYPSEKLVDDRFDLVEADVSDEVSAREITDQNFLNITSTDLGDNRYDNNVKTSGYYLSASNSLNANAAYAVTDYIEVNEGEIIVSSVSESAVNMRFVTAFDYKKDNLPTLGVSSYVGTYTVPATVKFIRITLDVGNAGTNTKIEASSTGTPTTFSLYEEKTIIISENSTPIDKPTDVIFDSNFEDSNFVLGNWTLSNNVLQSPTADFNDVAYYSGSYVTTDSDIVFAKIKLTTANSKIAISRNCALSQNSSRVDFVDFTNGKIGWYNYQVQNTLTDDETLYTVLEDYTMVGFSAVLNREYMIQSIRKDGYLARVILTDLTTFDTWQTDLKLANDVSGWGYRGISVISGSIDLLSFRVLSYQPYKPNLMIIGHSFVEGNSIGFPSKDSRYSALCRNALSGDCFIGGQGGATTQDLINRYDEYLFAMRPKYVLIDIGINDRVTYGSYHTIARMKVIAELVVKYGGIPIFATITPSNGISTTFLQAVNAWIKLSGYRYVDFAYVVTTNNDGVTYDGTYFLADGIHPTTTTHALLFNKIKYDVPEIFY